MRLSVGTSGYSYKEWKGPFYPDDLPASKMLGYYGERLPAVEINNTFYRLPKESVLESWRDQVPESFRFSIKASRRITHFARLKESAEDPTRYLLETIESLGDRLGVLLFQLPPNMKKDLPRLEAFLELLPTGTRAAFEFRHDSWFEEDVFAALRARELALVSVDADEAEPTPLVVTAPYGYLRLRRADYDAERLETWAREVAGQGWDEAFVFFKHEDEGAGPKLATAFLSAAERAAARRPARAAAKAPARKREAG